tara:strand:- start:167 stop:685 length:519 start_codon:yes stop_codon:yes gene_type:complete
MPLETESTLRIRSIIKDFKPNNGDLLGALHAVQHELGYLSKEALEVIADQFKMFTAEVYGMASFYEEYRFEPPPKTTVRWCSGPACRTRNSMGIRDAILATLDLDEMGEQTDDGECGIVIGQCNGTCEIAPMIWIEEHEVYERPIGNLTAAKSIKLMRALRSGSGIEDMLNG